MSGLCAWCGAPRDDDDAEKCPKCGAIYAKAAALRARGIADDDAPAPGVVPEAAPPPPPPRRHLDDLADLDWEWKARAIAIPAALAVAVLFHAFAFTHFLQRTFLSMMVHELGHATTALLCGFKAAPTLWKTIVGEHRTMIVTILVGGLVGAVLARWALARRWVPAGCTAVVLALLVVGTFGISESSAHAAVTFGGDGGAMVIGTILMTTFFAGRDTQLYQGALRWGFLVIGSAAYVDTFETWWTARTDPSVIPFGEIEGVGLSDPSKLHVVHGWATDDIVDRYVTLGVACLIVLAMVWAWQVRAARREAADQRTIR